ncbi:MAG TPA: hypothetical protein VG317_22590, partial [Pseudonocardiaceae bacterium]|nr:hypothetical protein [Pseudonocardiaceae bacterium]
LPVAVDMAEDHRRPDLAGRGAVEPTTDTGIERTMPAADVEADVTVELGPVVGAPTTEPHAQQRERRDDDRDDDPPRTPPPAARARPELVILSHRWRRIC